MLSCLSPRSPCCGPKARPARHPRSQPARRANERDRASPTPDAQAAPLADPRVVLAALDLRANGQYRTSSSSRANASGWWKSGLPGGCLSAQYESVPESSSITADSPSRKSRVDVHRRQVAKAHAGVELQFSCRVAHGNLRIQRLVRQNSTVTIAHEGVCRPLTGRSKVELMVCKRSFARHESLATRVLP